LKYLSFVALLASFIPLIAGKYTTVFGTDSCWIDDSEGYAWQLTLFYVPQAIGIAAAIGMMIHSIKTISKVFL
jgi:hypothetical protein